VISVEVRQDQPPQVRGLVSGLADRLCDQGRGAGQAGVDERKAAGIVPEVGVPDGRRMKYRRGISWMSSMRQR
jgi:hypothetical protein